MKIERTALLVSALLVASCGGGAAPESSPKTPQEPLPDQGAETPRFAEDAETPTTAAPAQAEDAAETESLESDSYPSGAPESRPGDDEEARESLVGVLDARFDEFGEALAAGASNCSEADRFRREVCRLSERICDLSRDLPRSSKSHSDCEDGKQRCDAANRRYSDVCG